MDVRGCIDQCFLGDATLEQLPAPSQVGKTKVGGIDFNRRRIRWAMEAVLALAPSPAGFTASQLAHQVRSLSQQSASEYGPRHAAYDLKKLRGKQRVGRMEKTRRYEPIREGLRVITALLTLRDKVLQPLLAAAQQLRPSHGAQNPAPIDRHCGLIIDNLLSMFTPNSVTLRPGGVFSEHNGSFCQHSKRKRNLA